MTILIRLLTVLAIAAVAGAFFIWATGTGDQVALFVKETTGIPLIHDKLGWMDDAELTPGDRKRIALVLAGGYNSNIDVIHAIQGGTRGNLTRHDFELLRQDIRRAGAAYSDIDETELLSGAWFNVDLSAHVPEDFCVSGNASGTQDGGRFYLDGACYIWFVKPQYTNRADAASVRAFEAELKRKRHEAYVADLRQNGPHAVWGGTVGSGYVRLDKSTGMIEIQQASEWSSTAKRWTMPFVADEWVDVSPYDLDAIRKLPSFAKAKEEDIKVEPAGTTLGTTSTGHPFDGTLRPGESVGVTTSTVRPEGR